MRFGSFRVSEMVNDCQDGDSHAIYAVKQVDDCCDIVPGPKALPSHDKGPMLDPVVVPRLTESRIIYSACEKLV